MVCKRLSLSITFVELFEKTIEVCWLDRGRNANGPFFVNTCVAILFSIFWWVISAVWAKDL